MHARKVNPSWCVTLPDQKQLPLSREMHFDSYFFLFVHREQQGMADDIYVEGVFPSYRRVYRRVIEELSSVSIC